MKKIFLLLTLVFSGNAVAGWYQGTVTNVFPVDHEGGRVYIFLNDGNGELSCGNGKVFYADPNTEIGKAILSVALVAKTTGKLVWVSGSGSCVEGWPSNGGEKIISIDLKG